MIEFSCPSCARTYRVADNLAGKTARCKECGNSMPIPGGQVPVAAPVAAPVSPRSADAPSGRVPSDAGQRRSAQRPSTDSAREILSGSSEHFSYEISQRPDFAMVKVDLEQGQKVFAEPSAMASMSPTVQLKAGFKGGLGKTLGRALGGESMIVNTFTADSGPGEVVFAAGAPGDAVHYELTGNTLFLQRGAFMLHSDGVEVSGKWKGAKGFFGGEGLVLLKASGHGDVFFNSYGAVLPIDVLGEYIVDTGYIVAFEDTLDYSVSVLPGLRAGGKLKTLFFGGEGLVCRFQGSGRLWVQTRHVHSFLSWVHVFRPTKSN